MLEIVNNYYFRVDYDGNKFYLIKREYLEPGYVVTMYPRTEENKIIKYRVKLMLEEIVE